jgi:hypothetical protein
VSTMVEFRCDKNPLKMFGRLITSGERPKVTNDNLMEFQCQACRTTYGRSGKKPRRVLHRFNIVGDLVETEVSW